MLKVLLGFFLDRTLTYRDTSRALLRVPFLGIFGEFTNAGITALRIAGLILRWFAYPFATTALLKKFLAFLRGEAGQFVQELQGIGVKTQFSGRGLSACFFGLSFSGLSARPLIGSFNLTPEIDGFNPRPARVKAEAFGKQFNPSCRWFHECVPLRHP